MSTSSPANAPEIFFDTHILKSQPYGFFLFFEEVTRARAHMRKSKLCSDCAWIIVQQVDFWVSKLTLCQKNVVQGGEDIEDASSCRSFFAKETLIIGLFCRKWPMTFEKRCTGWRRHRGCLIMYTSYYREVGAWCRDPKKCTGRDWGMGSSTI